MEPFRKIERIISGQMTYDGAGVRLNRIFGFSQEGLLDPFLLLDFFGSNDPRDFMAGFPWHPHRGIETVTYMLDGRVEHGDSMGNKGVIGKGDIQWMTAGSGIIHQEMPQSDGGPMFGFQLWVNLPASHKMMKPRYQDISASKVPEVMTGNGIRVKVLAGEYNSTRGPVEDIILNPSYFDVSMPANTEFTADIHPEYTAFAYLFEGEAETGGEPGNKLKSGQGAILSSGEKVRFTTRHSNARFILISGKPIHEPVAWGGPIVMNTREELDLAFREYREGNFIKNQE